MGQGGIALSREVQALRPVFNTFRKSTTNLDKRAGVLALDFPASWLTYSPDSRGGPWPDKGATNTWEITIGMFEIISEDRPVGETRGGNDFSIRL